MTARQLYAIKNVISRDESAGFARLYWARTTVSFLPRAWYWVSQPRIPLTATYWWPASPDWSPGAMSMAAGEYVSVHSQADTEQAELTRERAELAADGDSEHKELTAIYVARGLDPSLAKQVAEQLMAHDAMARMPGTNSASPILSVRVQFRLRSCQPPASRSGRCCLS